GRVAGRDGDGVGPVGGIGVAAEDVEAAGGVGLDGAGAGAAVAPGDGGGEVAGSGRRVGVGEGGDGAAEGGAGDGDDGPAAGGQRGVGHRDGGLADARQLAAPGVADVHRDGVAAFLGVDVAALDGVGAVVVGDAATGAAAVAPVDGGREVGRRGGGIGVGEGAHRQAAGARPLRGAGRG